MSLIDSNPVMDDEIAEIVESLMREHLATFEEGQWFTLRSLYAKLEIRFTLKREGSLDILIRRILDDWNWYPHNEGYWGLSYIRRNQPTDVVEFLLVDGTSVSTSYSWPPFSPPEPSPERKALLEEVRQRMLQRRNHVVQ